MRAETSAQTKASFVCPSAATVPAAEPAVPRTRTSSVRGTDFIIDEQYQVCLPAAAFGVASAPVEPACVV